MLQSSSSEKKLRKPLKNFFFWAQFAQKTGHYWPRLKWKTIFFCRNNKSRSPGFWNFLFYQNILFGWVMNLFLSWMMFFVKKVSFPAEKAVDIHSLPKITLGSRKHGNSVHSDSQNVSEPKEYPTSRAFNGARRNYTVNYVTHHPCLIFDCWDWGRIFIKWGSWEKSLKTLKRQKTQATKSFDIRDLFRRQKHSDLKKLRVEDIDPDMVIMD